MQVWEELLQRLSLELGPSVVAQWLRPLKVTQFDAANLYLEPQDPLQISWFEEHIRPRLKNRFLNNNGRPIRIHFLAPGTQKPTPSATESPPTFTIAPDKLDPEFTFEQFAPAPSNNVAFQLLSTLDTPTYNPIYLFGPKDSGKTHLLTAAAAHLQKKGKKVFFAQASTFTFHVIQAIRLGQMQELRRIYRAIDVLCIDNIDQLARKISTQEEFFHTFNTLHTSGKQLLFTASRTPSQLEEIEERLISRFEWGLTLEIGKTDSRTLLAKKAPLWNFTLSPEILSLLSEKFPLRPILALQALSLRGKGMHLTPEKVLFLLKDLLEQETDKALSPEKIIKAVADHYGVKSEDILGKSQTKDLVLPRQVAMYQCREHLKIPFQAIGKIFGKDHSTVMSSVRHVQKCVDEKKGPLLEALKETVRS